MVDITDKTGMEKEPGLPKAGQLAWFIGLYVAGLLVTALVAWVFRALLGMH